jgi:hypothetical protein
MFGIKRVLFAAAVGGGAMYFADHYHLVQTVDGLVVVPRAQQASLRTTYSDVRGWDATKWAQYPELSESLLKDGRGGLLIDGTVDGVLQQLGERIGLKGTEAAPVAGAAAESRPPIVFGTPGSNGPSLAPAAAAPADDSLLGRLSRQLQGANATSPALETRPIIRNVPAAEAAPLQPAFQPTQPAATNERVELHPNQLPQDFLPSIHSAAMQRITTTLGGSTAPPAATSGAWSPSMELTPNFVDALGTSLGAPAPAAATTPLAPVATSPTLNASSDAAARPLNLDADRLRQSLPATIQQELLRNLHTEPSAGIDSSLFRSF